MLTRQFLWEPPHWLVRLMSIVLALLTFLLLSRFVPSKGFLVAIGESIVVAFIVTAAFVWANIVLPFTPLLIAIGVGMLGAPLPLPLDATSVESGSGKNGSDGEDEGVGRVGFRVAHDVRNALSSVTMATELLLEEVADEEWRKHLVIIQQGIQDAINIVNRLRLFGKQTREQEVLMPVHLNELVTSTITFTRAKWFYEPMKRELKSRLKRNLNLICPQ